MLIKVRSAYGDFKLEGCKPEDPGSDLELALEEVLEQKDEKLIEDGYTIVRSTFSPSSTSLVSRHPFTD